MNFTSRAQPERPDTPVRTAWEPPAWAVALALLTLALAWGSSSLTAAELRLGNGSGIPGGVLFLPLTIEANPTMVAAQFDVLYSASVLASEGVLGAEGLTSVSLSSRPLTAGSRRVLLYSRGSTPLTGSLVLNLPLRVAAGAPPGPTTLAVTNVILSDGLGRRLAPVGVSPGQVQIGSAAGARFSSVAVDRDGLIRLQLRGVAGKTNLVEYTSDFRSWSLLGGPAPFSVDGLISLTDPNGVRVPYRFYRSLVSP